MLVLKGPTGDLSHRIWQETVEAKANYAPV